MFPESILPGSEQVLSLLLFSSCGWALPAPEEVVMCITFINNSLNPGKATLEISVNINHLHLSAWHFAKIRQLYLKLQLFDLHLFDFFLSIFMGQEFKKKKKHSYCLMKTAGNAFQKQRTALPFPLERPEF